MPATEFNFANSNGQQLSGVLETGSSPVHAYALFAHCFTCDKNSLAATRLSRALAEHGVGVLRFDFTGLGKSAGQFGRGLSGDIQDIACAAQALASAGMAPQLLIGHSFGGAAVLAAAGSLDFVKAVAVIGAPFDVEHILNQVCGALDGATADERVPVSIAGRDFSLSSGFVNDLRAQDQQSRIAQLGRALLVLHSPTDDVVSVDNAAKIFAAARHPKSFISLDGADHLLRNKADADYAAAVIASWSSRYLDRAPHELALPVHGVRVEETGGGKFQVRVSTAAGSFLADEPTSVGGLGSGPTPYDLLGAGLGACTAMTCRLYAKRHEWPLARVVVEIGHTGRTSTQRDVFVRKIGFEGALTSEQRARLLEIAERCPVHQTLGRGADVVTEPLPNDVPDIGAPDCPEDHLRQMEETCVNADLSVATPAP